MPFGELRELPGNLTYRRRTSTSMAVSKLRYYGPIKIIGSVNALVVWLKA